MRIFKNAWFQIEADELADFKELATLYLALSDEQIDALIENDALTEVPT